MGIQYLAFRHSTIPNQCYNARNIAVELARPTALSLGHGNRHQVTQERPRIAHRIRRLARAAFPVSLNAGNGNELTSIVFGGLTKREYAAVQIAGQLVPAYDRAELVTNPAFRGLLAAEAVAIADAVLAAAREPQPEPTA